MHRFLCPSLNAQAPTAEITQSAEIHHLINVLRCKTQDPVTIFNGQGIEADAIILKITGERIVFKILRSKNPPLPTTEIALACAIPKKAKFDLIIEKTTELGVSEIIPLQTARTQLKGPLRTLAEKRQRYERIALNASKQSQRALLPRISPIQKFHDLLKDHLPTTLGFIPSLIGNRQRLIDFQPEISKKPSRILFLIGPEGDFTPEEVAAAVQKGMYAVSLGDTVLKVDTAAISVVAFAKFCLSDH